MPHVTRSRIRKRYLAATLVLAPVIAVGTLALADGLRIGRTPAPCADRPAAHTTALVPSGGPNFRRTHHAVALYDNGRVPTAAWP